MGTEPTVDGGAGDRVSSGGSGHPRPESQAPTAAEARSTVARAGSMTGPALSVGTKFGRYTIVRPIGAGGMGAVYEALQDTPRRAVALKVIRGNMLSAQMLRRFEHESQVLGRLQHPGIAQVYEAGSVKDESGVTTPFFAMELIKGVPLTEYAASKGLGTRGRLELVARVCDAVYHAHQKGVIHRDLKPGNILVDESGQPKVLDFGVARATDSDIQQTTMQTDIGQLIGTVPYMSPEQVSGDPNELDTRSDVYALGVIAYELLAGRLPYDLQKKMIHEAVRVIREDEPTRLSSIDRALRGDIETIIGHALEKDKARRYQSAEALGSDIRRYLKDEPIAARPASTWYQAGKFARRNKVLVGGVAATFLALIAGIIGMSLMLKRALEAESDLTEQIGRTNAALTKAQEAESETKKRADELQQVSDFQERMLAQVDPTTAGVWLTEDVTKKLAAALEKAGVAEEERQAQIDAFRQQWVRVNATDAARELIDRTILRPAVKAIDEQFKDQPLIDAKLREALSVRYFGLGIYETGLQLQTDILDTRRTHQGGTHPDTLHSLHNLGMLYTNLGRLEEAEQCLMDAMEMCRRILGEDHPQTITSAASVGLLLYKRGDYPRAEASLSEALEKSRRVLGQEHRETIRTISSMALLLQDQGRFAEAEPLCIEALQKHRLVLGDEDPNTLAAIHNMGFLLQAQRRFAEADTYYIDALAKRRRVLGEEHPDTLISISAMGSVLRAQGKLAEAEPYTREDLEKCRRVLGSDHPDTIASLNNLGVLLFLQKQFSQAEPYYQDSLEKCRRIMGPEHPNTLWALNNMGFLLCAQGRLTEAEAYLVEALAGRRRVLGDSHPMTLASIIAMGTLWQQLGKNLEALELLIPVEGVARGAFANGDERLWAKFLTALGRARAGIGFDHERFTLTESNLLEAHPIFLRVRGESHEETLGCVRGLFDLYTDWHAAEPGKGYDAKAAEWRAKLPPEEKPAEPKPEEPKPGSP